MKVLATLLAAVFFAGSLQAGSSSATVQVSARVIGRTIITVQSEPQVTITATDLARGWVEVADPTFLSVKSNQRAGFRLTFAPTASWVAGGEVEGLSNPLVFASSGASAAFSYAGVAPRQLELRWKLHLSPDATAGTFPLPVSFATLN